METDTLSAQDSQGLTKVPTSKLVDNTSDEMQTKPSATGQSEKDSADNEPAQNGIVYLQGPRFWMASAA